MTLPEPLIVVFALLCSCAALLSMRTARRLFRRCENHRRLLACIDSYLRLHRPGAAGMIVDRALAYGVDDPDGILTPVATKWGDPLYQAVPRLPPDWRGTPYPDLGGQGGLQS